MYPIYELMPFGEAVIGPLDADAPERLVRKAIHLGDDTTKGDSAFRLLQLLALESSALVIHRAFREKPLMPHNVGFEFRK